MLWKRNVHIVSVLFIFHKVYSMACCDGWNLLSDGSKPNGVCPDCGVDTLDGDSVEGCFYSKVVCETCGDAPCDESC